jgi:3-hydroxyisobutyrate dehydrogenase-like beta-hydroxyacid dehydrogenase
MSKPIVGWIGLGSAGYPMATCLAKKGYRLLVRDADPNRAANFVAEYTECKVAGSSSTGFQDCDAVVTMLPNGKVVRDVLLGEHGIALNLKRGMVLDPIVN